MLRFFFLPWRGRVNVNIGVFFNVRITGPSPCLCFLVSFCPSLPFNLCPISLCVFLHRFESRTRGWSRPIFLLPFGLILRHRSVLSLVSLVAQGTLPVCRVPSSASPPASPDAPTTSHGAPQPPIWWLANAPKFANWYSGSGSEISRRVGGCRWAFRGLRCAIARQLSCCRCIPLFVSDNARRQYCQRRCLIRLGSLKVAEGEDFTHRAAQFLFCHLALSSHSAAGVARGALYVTRAPWRPSAADCDGAHASSLCHFSLSGPRLGLRLISTMVLGSRARSVGLLAAALPPTPRRFNSPG